MKRKVSSYNCKESEVTDETLFINRRSIIKQLGILGSAPFIINSSIANSQDQKTNHKPNARKLLSYKRDAISNDELTLENKAISHNNFYEFGSQKHQPAELSRDFKVKPWTLSLNEGDRSIKLSYDDLLDMFDLEERIYRLRCVEAWSMVIPWIGFPLSKLIEKLNPSSEAKWVRFQTIYNPSQMPGQRNYFLGGGIDYPYVEGLRLDEAMHPLTILAVGLYGKTLPPQNGAPVRLVVPWKYGFKSIKSVTKINFVEKMPDTSWNLEAPNEYGFYSNVNPYVSHPRWSQKRERRIGEFRKRDTLMHNGYAEHVAHLYEGMDLTKNF